MRFITSTINHTNYPRYEEYFTTHDNKSALVEYNDVFVRSIYEFSALFLLLCFFFFSSRRRHTRLQGDWSSDVCSSDLLDLRGLRHAPTGADPRDDTEGAAQSLWRDQAGDRARVALVRRGLRPALHREIGRASCRERV